MMWWSRPGTWVGWLAMSVMMVLFWGGIIALVVWLVRSSRGEVGRYDGSSMRGDASSILRERFARGEIDAQEYDERRRVLEGAGPRSPSDAGVR